MQSDEYRIRRYPCQVLGNRKPARSFVPDLINIDSIRTHALESTELIAADAQQYGCAATDVLVEK